MGRLLRSAKEKEKEKMKAIIDYIGRLLVSFDQFVNVLLSPLLNRLTSDNAYKFGHPDETLSSVMGKNIETGTCRGCHWICRWILHPIDRDHCKKSIEQDEHQP